MGLTQAIRVVGRLARGAEARQDALHDWRRRLGGEPDLPPGPIERVLVLCHGNVCRSPFAAALLAARLPQVEVRSAGLAAGGSDAAAPLARALAGRWGVSLDVHRTALLEASDLAWADLVLGMEGRHAVEIARRWPEARDKTHLLGHFLPEPPYTIDDPWGRSEQLFVHTFERVHAAVERLALRISGPAQ